MAQLRTKMASHINANTEAAILARVIPADEEELSPAAAQYQLTFRFGESDIARMSELSELAQQGKLTSQEQTELDSYIHVSNLLAIMQSKGRRALKRSTQ
jgi:hypothetical protein